MAAEVGTRQAGVDKQTNKIGNIASVVAGHSYSNNYETVETHELKPGFHPNATHATHATQAIAFGWKPGRVTKFTTVRN